MDRKTEEYTEKTYTKPVNDKETTRNLLSASLDWSIVYILAEGYSFPFFTVGSIFHL